MKPSEKRKARQESDKLRVELRQLEERLARFQAQRTIAGDSILITSTKNSITDIKRKITNLNIK